MKKRTPKHGSIAYYIEEVVKYRAEDETGQHVKHSYPPIMAELLLSLLIEVRTFCTAGRLLLGTLLGAAVMGLLRTLISCLQN